jgi:hypothetical protein
MTWAAVAHASILLTILLAIVSGGLVAILGPIIPAIIWDIILGIAFVASATTSPPVIAPRTAASTYPLVGELTLDIVVAPSAHTRWAATHLPNCEVAHR